MKVLLLGVGMQGKAALHDLVQCKEVTEIIAADRDIEGLKAYIQKKQYDIKVRCEHVDAASPESINRLVASGADVIIDLMPVIFHNTIAAAAVEYRTHLVNASYSTPEIKELSKEAKANGITILPEFGMDPGIDLVLLGRAVRSMEYVDDIITYGAGFPELKAADNPLKYKKTWTFDGVLKSYHRAGCVIRDGRIVEIKDNEMFNSENIHEIELEGIGKLEAFPNGNAINYADLLGVDCSGIRNLGRYVLRWPGHCAFWKILSDLHFLDDGPVTVDGTVVDRKRFLAALIEPQIQYGSNERDIVVVRVEVTGTTGGKRSRAVYQVIDRGDLKTGFTAMSRTVGYTVSIGARMIGQGQIKKRGVISPVNDIPYEYFKHELKKKNILITSEAV